MTHPGPLPEGMTWAVLDSEGQIVRYSTEPIELQMTAQLGDALGLDTEVDGGGDSQRDDQ